MIQRFLLPQITHGNELTVPINLGESSRDAFFMSEPVRGDVSAWEASSLWTGYQDTIGRLLVRMGREHGITETIASIPFVPSVDGISTRLALVPMMSRSAIHSLSSFRVQDLPFRLSGEFGLMELSAAAGYRTFCLPELIEGLMQTNKMRDKPLRRMIDTFAFLSTMMQFPIDHEVTTAQFKRTNNLHRQFSVAGSENDAAKDLFKYIALNMFYVGPRTRPDLMPEERHALCGMTVLVAKRMGHVIEGSVNDFDKFIDEYEQRKMFSPDDQSPLRRMAVAIAQSSEAALTKIPGISKERVHRDVPWRVKRILEIS